MKIGDKVTHVNYPSRQGTVAAKTKRWASGPLIILVNWGDSKHCSRHIPSALKKAV